jgi:integrase
MATIRKRVKKDGSISYQAGIVVKHNGIITHRESKSFSRENLAKVWAKRRESEIEKNIAEVGHVVKHETFKEVALLYLDYLDAQDSLRRTKRTTIEFLMRQPIAEMKISQITSAHIIPYLRDRVAGGAKPQTVNNDMAYIGSVMRYAEAMLDIPVNLNELLRAREKAVANKLISRPDKRERRPSEEEIIQIVDYFNRKLTQNWMSDVILFALHSARRQAEITRLKWEDLDVGTHTIVVRDMKHPTVKHYTKTAKLTDAALQIIQRQPKQGEHIFPHNHRTICSYFTQACKACDIDGLRFHDLRHEATSRLFEAGYSIVEVQQFTLHESWNTLKRYTHLRPEDVRLR